MHAEIVPIVTARNRRFKCPTGALPIYRFASFGDRDCIAPQHAIAITENSAKLVFLSESSTTCNGAPSVYEPRIIINGTCLTDEQAKALRAAMESAVYRLQGWNEGTAEERTAAGKELTAYQEIVRLIGDSRLWKYDNSNLPGYKLAMNCYKDIEDALRKVSDVHGEGTLCMALATYLAAEFQILMQEAVVTRPQVEELMAYIQDMAFAPPRDS